MQIDYSVLDSSEKIIFSLRSLYKKYGYIPYKMSKFEEYDLYGKNKDFLISDSVITFTDTNGKLLALKPDVTLSIIKNSDDDFRNVRKLYYNENVYRVSKGSNNFQEIMQTGLECIGNIDFGCISEVLVLASKSLDLISRENVLEISDMDILTSLLNIISDNRDIRQAVLKCVTAKNIHEIESICTSNGIDPRKASPLITLLGLYGTPEEVMPELKTIAAENGAAQEVYSFEKAVNLFRSNVPDGNVVIDFSLASDTAYYNGIVFKGFIEGIPDSVLSGGQYDKLMKRMHKKSGAVGFAVYLDVLERLGDSGLASDESPTEEEIMQLEKERHMINVALPKGRLGEKVYNIFEKAGFECPSIHEENRKLIFENEQAGVRYFWVKPSDVAIYVERGAADIGVAGKDILLEYEPDVYELSDLNIGKCRMCVAAPAEFVDDIDRTLIVATKFSNIAYNYYASKGRNIDIIHLNGSIEIAPILGLTDVIVDIVETGTTLKENNLKVFEEIIPISARLISNKSSFKFKNEIISRIVREVENLKEA